MTGRPLRPPQGETALDRAWRRRQWRLERAHDDWGLHAGSGDPRTSIHRASGFVRHCRQSVRDKVRAYRRGVSVAGEGSEARVCAKHGIDLAFHDYRLAIADLARAVAAFDDRNAEIAAMATPQCRDNLEDPVLEPAL